MILSTDIEFALADDMLNQKQTNQEIKDQTKTSISSDDAPYEEKNISLDKKTISQEDLTNILPDPNLTRNLKNNLKNALPFSSEPVISYTNPSSGISIFGQDYYSNIYTSDSTEWARYDFYLTRASFVTISVFGDVMGFQDKYSIGLITENNIGDPGPFIPLHSYGMCNSSYCYDNYQMTKLRYLEKGWHTVYLEGSADGGNDGFYWTYGYISVLAIPEYTALTVVSPNGGETWYRGQTKTITWKNDGKPGNNVIIELYKNGVRNAVISSKTANDGLYSWYIPSYQPIGADYKIKITGYEDKTYYDWSNGNFKIY